MGGEFHLVLPDGSKENGLSEEGLKARISKGEIPLNAHVWQPGMPDWRLVSEVFPASEAIPPLEPFRIELAEPLTPAAPRTDAAIAHHVEASRPTVAVPAVGGIFQAVDDQDGGERLTALRFAGALLLLNAAVSFYVIALNEAWEPGRVLPYLFDVVLGPLLLLGRAQFRQWALVRSVLGCVFAMVSVASRSHTQAQVLIQAGGNGIYFGALIVLLWGDEVSRRRLVVGGTLGALTLLVLLGGAGMVSKANSAPELHPALDGRVKLLSFAPFKNVRVPPSGDLFVETAGCNSESMGQGEFVYLYDLRDGVTFNSERGLTKGFEAFCRATGCTSDGYQVTSVTHAGRAGQELASTIHLKGQSFRFRSFLFQTGTRVWNVIVYLPERRGADLFPIIFESIQVDA